MLRAKVFVAEFIGTFALVFVGSAAAIYGQSLGLLGIALAHGLTLAVFMYLFGHLSGAHFNPAVTLGLTANGNLQWGEAALYWAAQFSGAAIAAVSLRAFVDPLSTEAISGALPTGLLTTEHPYYGLALEALLTFFLMTAFMRTLVAGKASASTGWATGGMLVIAMLAGHPLTGAALNPARALGPALLTGVITPGTPDYQNTVFYLIYFVGPFLGALAAALLSRFFAFEPAQEDVIDEVEVLEEDEEEEIIEVESPAERKAKK